MSKSKIRVKDLKLIVRIQQDSSGFYYAQVYRPEILDSKELLYYMNCNLEIGWNTVAKECLTKWGCKHAVKVWKKKHFIEIIEM